VEVLIKTIWLGEERDRNTEQECRVLFKEFVVLEYGMLCGWGKNSRKKKGQSHQISKDM